VHFSCYYAALLPRRGRILRRTLSVCLSVRPSVPFAEVVLQFYSRTVLRANIQNRKTYVFAYGPASRMLRLKHFSPGAEGRLSYGHLGRTNLLSVCEKVLKQKRLDLSINAKNQHVCVIGPRYDMVYFKDYSGLHNTLPLPSPSVPFPLPLSPPLPL